MLALKLAMRLVLIIISGSLLTFTTTPILLTDGIEKLLSPFRRIGLPAHELAMMMSIALRFIPTLLEETDKIMKAQAARGADFDTGNLVQRAKSFVPVLVPLFVVPSGELMNWQSNGGKMLQGRDRKAGTFEFYQR